MPTPVSCYVLTFNSERRLAEVLASVRDVVDEIVIVDSGSTDGTLAIAERFGGRILSRPFDNFRDQRLFAEGSCTHDWVFAIDSDEVVTPALAGEIAALKDVDFHAPDPKAHDGYTVPRDWILLGRRVHVFYPIRTPDRLVRLFRRDRINHRNSPIIHERPSGSQTGLGHLKGGLLHYTCDSVEQLYSKINLYTRLSAEEMHANGVHASAIRMHLFPLLIAAKFYFVMGGWKDGAVGRLHARYVRDIAYLKYAKLKHDFSSAKR